MIDWNYVKSGNQAFDYAIYMYALWSQYWSQKRWYFLFEVRKINLWIFKLEINTYTTRRNSLAWMMDVGPRCHWISRVIYITHDDDVDMKNSELLYIYITRWEWWTFQSLKNGWLFKNQIQFLHSSSMHKYHSPKTTRDRSGWSGDWRNKTGIATIN